MRLAHTFHSRAHFPQKVRLCHKMRLSATMKSPSACRNMQIFHTLFTQPGKSLFSPARPVERREVQTCRNSFAPPLNNAAVLVIRPEIQSTKSSIRTFFAPRCKNVCSTLYEKDKYMNKIASPSCALCTFPCYWCILWYCVHMGSTRSPPSPHLTCISDECSPLIPLTLLHT